MLATVIILFTTLADTLYNPYGDRWDGVEADKSSFVSFMTSNDMIFVVLGVSLIIWFSLIFFLVKTEHKLKRIEKELDIL
jgi:hypothetical protein